MGFGCLSPLPSCSATLLLGPDGELWWRTAAQFTEHEKNRAKHLFTQAQIPDFGSLGLVCYCLHWVIYFLLLVLFWLLISGIWCCFTLRFYRWSHISLPLCLYPLPDPSEWFPSPSQAQRFKRSSGRMKEVGKKRMHMPYNRWEGVRQMLSTQPPLAVSQIRLTVYLLLLLLSTTLLFIIVSNCYLNILHRLMFWKFAESFQLYRKFENKPNHPVFSTNHTEEWLLYPFLL